MKHPFSLERGGRTCHLVKHPRDRKLPAEDQAKRPWYIRVAVPGEKHGRWKKVGEAHELETAVAAARDLLLKARVGGNPFTELYEATRYRATLTAGAVLEAWAAAGCPATNGVRRPPAEITRQARHLKLALPFWAARGVTTITSPTLHEYATWRRGRCRDGAVGNRSIDLELTTLCNAFAWAVAVGKADRNPFLRRPRFHTSEAVEHCNQFMPSDDDELHRLTGALVASADPFTVVAGAQLLFQALTGLRSGEPGYLRWDAGYEQGHPAPGRRYAVTLEGQPRELLAVRRLKGGINPAVPVHPALQQFLAAWEPYCRATWPGTPYYFPNPDKPGEALVTPEDKQHRLSGPLNDAAAALGLPERHPHAMRAYYVRVRRSQGYRDAIIAEELGQGSGPRQVVSTYGDPRGVFGDGRYDWLPEVGEVNPVIAWTRLHPGRSNLVLLTASVNAPRVHPCQAETRRTDCADNA